MPWRRILAYVTGEVDESLLLRIEYLIEENRVLRGQVKRLRLSDTERRTLAEKAMQLGKLMADTVTIVKPETLLKWHRELIARKYNGSEQQKHFGRPRITAEIRDLVISMAKDNPTWGYDRICGAIRNLGFRISDQSVGNILRRCGLAPAPERRQQVSWHRFLRLHRENLWATDFLTTEVWTKAGLTTFYTLFFIKPGTRKVVIGGITATPDEDWMKQIARNVTGWGGALEGARFLIHDRDSKYGKSFDAIFESVGTECIMLPPRSPNLNAYAERFVLSIKTECLEQVIVLGEGMLRRMVREYVAHYHTERNHQGIGNVIPFPDDRLQQTGPVRRKDRLGGMLSFYHREAA